MELVKSYRLLNFSTISEPAPVLRLALRNFFWSGAPACAPTFGIFRSGAPAALRRFLKEWRSSTCAPAVSAIFAQISSRKLL